MSKADKTDILETLNGMEIHSSYYGACVLVDGLNVVSMGKVIDTLNTSRKINRLLDEAFKEEFGTTQLNTIFN